MPRLHVSRRMMMSSNVFSPQGILDRERLAWEMAMDDAKTARDRGDGAEADRHDRRAAAHRRGMEVAREIIAAMHQFLG